jgi:hypothetical protein
MTKHAILVAVCVGASMLSCYLYLGVAKRLYDRETAAMIRQEMADRLTANRLFQPANGMVYHTDDFLFKPLDDFQWDLVTDTEGYVLGVHVEFPKGKDACLAMIATPNDPKAVVKFFRGKGIGSFWYGDQALVSE